VSSSSVPPIQFTPAGIILPTEAAILGGVQADINAAFGGGLNPALATPQGQLASSETAAIGAKNSEVAYLVNQFDPQYSAGRFQDGHLRMYGLTRKPAISTQVECLLTGVPGTVIAAGKLASDTQGNLYALASTVVITSSSSILGIFNNVVPGPTPCPAGSLVNVYQAVNGWDTVNNPADGVIGRDVERRADAEFRRQQSIGINGSNSLAAVRGAVFNVHGVIDAYVYENFTDATVTVGATSRAIIKKSIYVCVQGGTNTDVGAAILSKKSLGCDTNGSSTVFIADTSYNLPYPSYEIKFQRPALLPIKFAVQVANSTTLPANITDLIKAAIISRFGGQDGTNRERIGGTVYATRYYSIPVQATIISMLVGLSMPSSNAQAVGIDQLPTLTASDITVTYV